MRHPRATRDTVLVVECLAGGTLEDRLRDGPIAPAEAVSVVARWADAQAARHENGCLYEDGQPRNSGCTAEGLPAWRDFGLAHAVDEAARVGGTRPARSPEGLAGRPAEDTDDVRSLCVVLRVSGWHPVAAALAAVPGDASPHFFTFFTLPVRFSPSIRP